jgi:hypothetical protein
MYKKKLNIILLSLVLIVWGAIIYRIARQYLIARRPENRFAQSVPNNALIIPQKDTFLFKNIERDPFTDVNQKPLITFHAQRETITKNQTSHAVSWPQVKYFGFIKSKDKKTELVLLQIDGSLKKVRVGSVVADILIKKVYKDSINLIFNNENKIFRLK